MQAPDYSNFTSALNIDLHLPHENLPPAPLRPPPFYHPHHPKRHDTSVIVGPLKETKSTSFSRPEGRYRGRSSQHITPLPPLPPHLSPPPFPPPPYSSSSPPPPSFPPSFPSIPLLLSPPFLPSILPFHPPPPSNPLPSSLIPPPPTPPSPHPLPLSPSLHLHPSLPSPSIPSTLHPFLLPPSHNPPPLPSLHPPHERTRVRAPTHRPPPPRRREGPLESQVLVPVAVNYPTPQVPLFASISLLFSLPFLPAPGLSSSSSYFPVSSLLRCSLAVRYEVPRIPIFSSWVEILPFAPSVSLRLPRSFLSPYFLLSSSAPIAFLLLLLSLSLLLLLSLFPHSASFTFPSFFPTFPCNILPFFCSSSHRASQISHDPDPLLLSPSPRSPFPDPNQNLRGSILPPLSPTLSPPFPPLPPPLPLSSTQSNLRGVHSPTSLSHPYHPPSPPLPISPPLPFPPLPFPPDPNQNPGESILHLSPPITPSPPYHPFPSLPPPITPPPLPSTPLPHHRSPPLPTPFFPNVSASGSHAQEPPKSEPHPLTLDTARSAMNSPRHPVTSRSARGQRSSLPEIDRKKI
ncbi:hypothetical protein C7M84_006957 [Penaeus vannamei]|uniref:Uncharacterized protein n=1 Tax=Penaeus vannamei TaxID=6689 RepID=A0A423TDM6_PENVA|nr:hypothetical protein C7M84_006957 [Penaeus vannamei]